MSLCMAMDCVIVDSPEEMLILSSLLHVTGRARVKGVQWCVAGVYGVTTVGKEEKSVIRRMNFCGDMEEETVLEEDM